MFEDPLHGIFLNYLKLFPNQESGTLSVLYKSPLTFDNKLDFFLILLDIDGRKQISGKTQHGKDGSCIQSKLQSLELCEIGIRFSHLQGITYL